MKLADEDLIKFAKARFNGSDAPVSFEALAKQFPHDKSVLCRAISDAFRRRLVEVREREQDPFRRIGGLEHKLQEAFNLLGAIVIDTNVPSRAPTQTAGSNPSDMAHALLGRALASLIATGAVFRDHDRIGLGSGRGVYYTVEALAKLPRLRASNVTIVSLTGDVYAQDHAKIIDSKMDADMHARLLSLAFAGKVHLYSMGSRILYSDTTILEAVRTRTWSDPQWPKITHALVGVGALAPGHRFFDEITTSHPEPILAPVHAELRELVSLSQKITAGSDDAYCPVADISNNLFFVRPPSGVSVQDKMEHRIRELIGLINPRLLNVPEGALKETGTILLVAGTKQKALAIRELLTSEPYRIRFLCTDRAAAEIILKEVEG